MKRFFDLTVTFMLMLVLMVPFLFLTALVWLKLGSPAIFRQTRPGMYGTPFVMLKVRTMTSARNDKGELLPDSNRLTPLGNWLRATSLDELPELWNVFKGDMSLVGPRPLLMEYLPLYNERQRRRHEVRPGITGWAQVNGRNSLSWEEKLELDVWYVENQSFWLDMKILWMTVWQVLARRGINQEGHVTVERFRGE